MAEPVLDDDLWDRVTREPPPILEMMQTVWAGNIPPLLTEDYHRTKKWMEEDPKGFGLQIVGLERAYQVQVLEANKRDKRIRELEGKVAELEHILATVGPRAEEVLVDVATGKVLDLIDKLRTQFHDESETADRKGKAGQ